MRIVAGRFKGKVLSAPEGETTRPTSDRARQAIFNILEHAAWAPRLEGLRVMDMFAGSGALGFEALSRGASFCLFVETDAEARGVIRQNAEAMDLFGNTRIHRRDATDLGVRPGSAGEAFDLIFLDPPYGRGLGDQAMSRLIEGQWVAGGAIAVFERGRDEPEPVCEGWATLDQRDYGAARVWFLQRQG